MEMEDEEGAGRRLQKNLGEADGLGVPETKQAASPYVGQSLTRSGGGRQAPGRARAVTAALASPPGRHPQRPWSRASLRISRVRTLQDPGAAAASSAWPQCRGRGRKRPRGGAQDGTLLRVNAPFRDSGERPPRAGCPGTSESHGDRYQVQSRTQSWEKKAATDGKMAGSATTYAGLKARLFLTNHMSDWVAFNPVPLIGWRFRSHPE